MYGSCFVFFREISSSSVRNRCPTSSDQNQCKISQQEVNTMESHLVLVGVTSGVVMALKDQRQHINYLCYQYITVSGFVLVSCSGHVCVFLYSCQLYFAHGSLCDFSVHGANFFAYNANKNAIKQPWTHKVWKQILLGNKWMVKWENSMCLNVNVGVATNRFHICQ